jgi:hypothetical protein
MKFSMMIISAVAIHIGLCSRHSAFVVTGASIYLLAAIADLFHAYRDAKALRRGTLEADSTPSFYARASRWLEGSITLFGLILALVTRDSDSTGYAIGGSIIWGGAIICSFVSGIIAREVGGIPLSMGYGGWKVRRDRRGNFRT